MTECVYSCVSVHVVVLKSARVCELAKESAHVSMRFLSRARGGGQRETSQDCR